MMLLGNINAILFRRRFGGGGGTPFPNIPGMITRYSASGLTNEQMKENPVWVDKTGNGHDLQMKNFLWGGMSGVGGYKLNWGDFSIWANYITQGVRGTGEVTDNTIHITSAKSNNALFETRASLKSVEYKVLIKGLTDDIYLRYGVSNDGKELWTEIKNDGIYTLPSYDYDSKYNMRWVVMSQTYPIDCNITIEQLPLYPGALVFDGVGDYGVCENFPILTKEKGYTVVALRRWLSFQDIGYPSLVVNSTDRLAAFNFEDFRNETKSTWNWGRSVGLLDNEMPLLYTYQTSTSYNGRTIPSGAIEEGSNILQVCRSGVYFPNAAIWEIVILDHDATEEELTKIKDYFVKAYPWLFPDQAWTVTGKTNEDEDRATIANITGNGNDLVLSNFGFAEGSGYGLYAENYADGRWVQSTDRADLTWTSYSVNMTSVKVASTQLYYQSYPEQPSFIVPSYKIKVYGLKDGQTLSYRQATSEGQKLYRILEDGTYTLPSFSFKANRNWYGFILNKVQESCDITIEQIPEYEGYLVTDGVDDIIQSKRFLLHRNWTMVGDWRFMPPEKNTNSGIVKSSAIRLYNQLNNIAIHINRTTNLKSISGRSIKTVCSDGRIYLDDWSEFLDTELQTDFDNNAVISIANYGVNFTKMIFKNLSFYDNQLLSKDDCIKAYNYLQTLKAK